jgi:hypothetical protein
MSAGSTEGASRSEHSKVGTAQGRAGNCEKREMRMHASTFEYLKPSDEQKAQMQEVRAAAAKFAEVLDRVLPEGPDKTFVMRQHRTTAMWAMVTITRQPDGTPRA